MPQQLKSYNCPVSKAKSYMGSGLLAGGLLLLSQTVYSQSLLKKAVDTHIITAKDITIESLLKVSTSIIISGNVKTGNSNELLPGVNVIIKGTTIGCTTDMEGKFSIKLEKQLLEKPIILVFSFVGFQIEEVNLDMSQDKTPLSQITTLLLTPVFMKEDIMELLGDVVIVEKYKSPSDWLFKKAKRLFNLIR
ncbi:MAG: carboxypeptidase-like regulatory domain-containing protein [Verrucomicrobia bacterium]|nr:carboxypeptidase-like regulatory domain-containing protein [Cytophagales bacterium]